MDKIQAFDSIFSNNHLQMYKILLPYLEPPLQKQLILYIKYEELRYTLKFLSEATASPFPKCDLPEAGSLYQEIAPYCSPTEKGKLEQLANMISNIKNMKEMMEMIQSLQEMFPEGVSPDGPAPDFSQFNGQNIFELLKMFGNKMDM